MLADAKILPHGFSSCTRRAPMTDAYRHHMMRPPHRMHAPI